MTQKTFLHFSLDGDAGVNVGDEVILIEKYNENNGGRGWDFSNSKDGIGGNLNGSIKRYHGWRGTTNNISITAHGLRRVMKVEETSAIGQYKVTVGKDLHPDWE